MECAGHACHWLSSRLLVGHLRTGGSEMIASPSPAVAPELREAARHLIAHPLVLAERYPDKFRLIRRHEQQLDRWFTQRFGYRLQVTADAARLFKSTVVASRRPLRATAKRRPFSLREYTMLALALAAVSAGPNIISLRDLVHRIRSAAAEADIALAETFAERRALVTALRWMIGHGVATELHDRVEGYAADDAADAVLRIRPDRVALLPLPALARASTANELLDRSERRISFRAWIRSMLIEEPVLYREEVDEPEWTELRKRLRDEATIFNEMFGARIEARAEGVLVIDPDGEMTDTRFPVAGTSGHAALLLIEQLAEMDRNPIPRNAVVSAVAKLARKHRRYLSSLADDAEKLTRDVLERLIDHRLVDVADNEVRLLPAAWRYAVDVKYEQMSLL